MGKLGLLEVVKARLSAELVPANWKASGAISGTRMEMAEVACDADLNDQKGGGVGLSGVGLSGVGLGGGVGDDSSLVSQSTLLPNTPQGLPRPTDGVGLGHAPTNFAAAIPALYDLVVLGGGPGGVAAAREAAALGRNVAVINCTHENQFGCCPRAALHKIVERVLDLQDAQSFGWENVAPTINWAGVTDGVERHLNTVDGSFREAFQKLGISVFEGRVRFIGKDMVRLVLDASGDESEHTRDIKALVFLVAVGALSRVPPSVRGASKFGTPVDALWSLCERPRSVCVVGGDVDAVETAALLATLATGDVTLVTRKFLPLLDRQMADMLLKHLESRGVTVLVDHEVDAVEPGRDDTPESLHGENGDSGDGAGSQSESNSDDDDDGDEGSVGRGGGHGAGGRVSLGRARGKGSRRSGAGWGGGRGGRGGDRFGSQPGNQAAGGPKNGSAAYLRVLGKGPGEERVAVPCDTVLFATGREPAVADLDLAVAGVKMQHGRPRVDANGTTCNAHVFIIGDAMDGRPHPPAADTKMGLALIRRLFCSDDAIYPPSNHTHSSLAEPGPSSRPPGPSDELIRRRLCVGLEPPDLTCAAGVVRTDLEYAYVGMTEEDAINRYGQDDIEVYHAHFTPLEWALPGRNRGISYAKILCVKSERERVLGVHLFSPKAADAVTGFAIALRLRATRADLSSTIGIHPTVAEELFKLKVTKASGENVLRTEC